MKKKQYQGEPGVKLLKIIHQYFPKVEKVNDADKKYWIEVTKEDSVKATIQDPALCAFARACYRSFNADGVLIWLTTAYIIKGKIALRLKLRESVSREVISFDRKGGFAPGIYCLVPFSPRQRLGVFKNRPTHPKRGGEDRRELRHFTTGVRVVNQAK